MTRSKDIIFEKFFEPKVIKSDKLKFSQVYKVWDPNHSIKKISKTYRVIDECEEDIGNIKHNLWSD